VRAWRWICGVKPTLKAGNTPSPHCIVHGLGKPGGFTTVSKSLSFCHLTKQPLINELEDRVDERHSRHDGSSSDYRPKFRVFTEKAYVPRVIITDKLKSDGAAKREILPGVEHRQSRYLNNRCENSHRPTRQQEHRMPGFKSAGHAQRFLSASGPIAQHFRPRRPLLSAPAYRKEMRQRFASWAEVTGTERAS